jgi:hypothetical protein
VINAVAQPEVRSFKLFTSKSSFADRSSRYSIKDEMLFACTNRYYFLMTFICFKQ